MRSLIGLILLGAAGSVFASPFAQTNLVSDLSGMALTTDPNLKDPWGMSFSGTSPFWISDRAAGVSTLYSGAGAIVPLVVAIPPGAPLGPTGQVFAGPTTSFVLNGNPALFIFDTLGGTIDAWNGGASATQVASTAGAQYEGLALANNTLFAANFVAGGQVDMFNSSYALTGSFTDATIPAGYAPFNAQAIGGKIYVTYGKLTAGVPVPLPGGGGFVDVFDTAGNFLQRLASNGPLDAPWGIAMAPAAFGEFGGDLMVGNFGNGEINAFDPVTGQFKGTLTDASGNPIANPGLWAINFGNSSANPNALYFNVGLNAGQDGLFAEIQAVPEPGSLVLMTIGLLGIAPFARRRLVG
jgi:uncharacterized protein (TIGR03118 family)